ncbi:MAG: polysaccharide deacetylase [Bacteroidetes bacterium]|nr:polysaccharide deacetylase [Bacteroidota bacterium]
MKHIHLLAVIAILAGCNQPAANNQSATPAAPEQKWTWSTERLEKAVAQVRAGKDLTPKTWPNGAKVAVLLSFDVDNETIAWWEGEPTISELSRGEYGSRVALKRIVNLLEKEGVPASFFIPALSLHLSPQMADEIKRLPRHEFAVHGWIHERNTQVPPDKEREMIVNAHKKLSDMTGETIVGYRAPSWNFSPVTPQIIQDMKFIYESSMMSDDRPYELVIGGKPSGIVELPVEWILDDAPLLDPRGDRYTAPRDWMQVQKDEFDVAYEEGTMFLLTMHPHYIGHRSRIVVLEELIQHMKSKGKVWFATHKEAAEYVKEQAGMK